VKLASFDVETRGVLQEYALQPFRARTGQAWLTMCATASKDDGAVSMVKPTREQLKAWLDTNAASGHVICGWNIAFDMAWLIALGLREEVYANKWLDGMVLWRHLTASPKFTKLEPMSLGLKAAVAEFLPGFAGYDEDIEFDTDDPEKFAQLVVYNKQDAVFTLILCTGFLKRLTPKQVRNVMIEAACLPMVAESYVEGICINVDAAKALEQSLTDTANLAMVKLKLNSSEDIDPSVLASPTKLRKLLYEDWGLKAPKYTDKGAESTDRDALSQLADKDPRASLLNEYREAKNNCTKFATGAITSVEYNGDGRSRPQFKVFGTYTGRGTYSSKIGRGKAERPTGVPLHQWKRAQDFRELIEAPEGYELLEFDFAGQEFRWMAVMSQDRAMLKLCQPGEDAHAYMGARIGRWEYTKLRSVVGDRDHVDYATAKNLRQMGKVGNLSCIAAGQQVLTDRGYISIEQVRVNDKLWDGVEWVNHDGVICQGVKDVIAYDGIVATPDHKVLVSGQWERFDKAALHGAIIDRSLGADCERVIGSTIRVVGGIVLRTIHEVRRAICDISLPQLRDGEGRQPAYDGGWPDDYVQGVLYPATARSARPSDRGHASEAATAAAGSRHASALHQPEGSGVQKLWRARGGVSVSIRAGLRGVRAGASSVGGLLRGGYRSLQQRRSLRARQSALGNAGRELTQSAEVGGVRNGRCVGCQQGVSILHSHRTSLPPHGPDSSGDHRSSPQGRGREAQILGADRGKVAVYDILNAGPRHRFVVNGRIVSNCQYRISASSLRRTARVGYQLNLTESEARAIHATYLTTYPGVSDYWRNQIANAQAQGYVETVAGRRIQLGPQHAWTKETIWGRESAAINSPIQGSGADQKYLALAVLRDYLPKVDGLFYMELHDGLFVIVPHRHADRAVAEIKQLLSNLPYRKAWGVNLPVQFPVDAKRGRTGGQLKEAA